MESVENVEAQKAQLLQWMGAKLNGSHLRGLEWLYNESHPAVARRYHPEDDDCLTA